MLLKNLKSKNIKTTDCLVVDIVDDLHHGLTLLPAVGHRSIILLFRIWIQSDPHIVSQFVRERERQTDR